MPRTRSSKKDERTPLEKLLQIDDKVDRLLFFEYHDGFNTEGALGIDVNSGNPGSAKHRIGIFRIAYTKSQFYSKGRKLASLAKDFIKNKELPPEELRPRITAEEVEAIREANKDARSLEEKFDEVTDPLELFVFFKYYDGFHTRGEVGFNPKSGPPGSINHKRAYATLLSEWSESQFRNKGQLLGVLAVTT